MPHHIDRPSKLCALCGRPFQWRRRWKDVWEEVRYCSERCRNRARRPANRRRQQEVGADGGTGAIRVRPPD